MSIQVAFEEVTLDFSNRKEILLSDMGINPSLATDAISKLDAHMAKGANGIPAIAIKKCDRELSPVLFNLCNS